MQFDRTYQFMVGPAGGSAKVAADPMEIEFEVVKTITREPNYSKFKIFNLGLSTREEMCRPDQYCVLVAGYLQGMIARVSTGKVVDGHWSIDGPDVVTEVVALESLEAHRDAVVSISLPGGATARQVFAEVASQMSCPLTMADDVPDRVWPGGFSYYGQAMRALDKAVAAASSEWSIQDETIRVIPRGGTARQGLVLNAGSGLIGTPERQLEGAKQYVSARDETSGKPTTITKKQTKTGWKVKALLLPQVLPGDLVKIESAAVTGWFRCDKVHHRGKFSTDWQTELFLVDPKSPVAEPYKAGGSK